MLRNQCQDFWKWLGLKGRKRIPSPGLSGVRPRAPREEPGDGWFPSRSTLKTLMCLNNRSLSLLTAGLAPLTGWPTNHFCLMTLAPSSLPGWPERMTECTGVSRKHGRWAVHPCPPSQSAIGRRQYLHLEPGHTSGLSSQIHHLSFVEDF